MGQDTVVHASPRRLVQWLEQDPGYWFREAAALWIESDAMEDPERGILRRIANEYEILGIYAKTRLMERLARERQLAGRVIDDDTTGNAGRERGLYRRGA